MGCSASHDNATDAPYREHRYDDSRSAMSDCTLADAHGANDLLRLYDELGSSDSSAGEVAREPKPVAIRAALRARLVVARVAHGVNADPDQYASEIARSITACDPNCASAIRNWCAECRDALEPGELPAAVPDPVSTNSRRGRAPPPPPPLLASSRGSRPRASGDTPSSSWSPRSSSPDAWQRASFVSTASPPSGRDAGFMPNASANSSSLNSSAVLSPTNMSFVLVRGGNGSMHRPGRSMLEWRDSFCSAGGRYPPSELHSPVEEVRPWESSSPPSHLPEPEPTGSARFYSPPSRRRKPSKLLLSADVSRQGTLPTPPVNVLPARASP